MPKKPISPGIIESHLHFLHALFSRMKDKQIAFSVLHNGEDLRKSLLSDIDIAMASHPYHDFLKVLIEICNELDYQVIHSLHYEVPYGYYFILASNSEYPAYIHLDCLYDPIGVNWYLLQTPYLIEGHDTDRGFPNVNRAKSALYLLIKRSIKGSLTQERFDELRSCLAEQVKNIQNDINEQFGRDSTVLVDQLLRADNPAAATPILAMLKSKLKRQFLQTHPLKVFMQFYLDLFRKIRRFFSPTGFFLVLIGPDGCGKSTITNELLEIMDRGFRKSRHFHWRPGLLPRLGGNSLARQEAEAKSGSNAPATVSRYRGPASLIRFIYYSLDFIIGYWSNIYPHKAQTTFVIGERYFPDILVHPPRYGFSVPRWFMRITASLVPNPDLIVLLSNDPEIIHARKDELPIELIRQQLDAYRAEIPKWGNSMVVSTNIPADQVAAQIAHEIIRLSATRTAGRLRKFCG